LLRLPVEHWLYLTLFRWWLESQINLPRLLSNGFILSLNAKFPDGMLAIGQ
jgi:hypothetical protein